VGLGMSGVGVCRYLSEKEITFCAQDTRDNPASLSEVKTLTESDLIVLSPGISLQMPELKAAKDAGVRQQV